MKNPFERGQNNNDKYTPDPQVLSLLMTKAETVAAGLRESGTDVSAEDVHSAVIRAMHSAERTGDPFTKEEIEAGTADLEGKLEKALKVQVDMNSDGGSHERLIDSDGTVIGSVGSHGEAGKLAQEQREARENV